MFQETHAELSISFNRPRWWSNVTFGCIQGSLSLLQFCSSAWHIWENNTETMDSHVFNQTQRLCQILQHHIVVSNWLKWTETVLTFAYFGSTGKQISLKLSWNISKTIKEFFELFSLSFISVLFQFYFSCADSFSHVSALQKNTQLLLNRPNFYPELLQVRLVSPHKLTYGKGCGSCTFFKPDSLSVATHNSTAKNPFRTEIIKKEAYNVPREWRLARNTDWNVSNGISNDGRWLGRYNWSRRGVNCSNTGSFRRLNDPAL